MIGMLRVCFAASMISAAHRGERILGVAGLVMAILWTRWLGIMRPRCWAKAVVEGSLPYIGAVCFANFLLLALGTAPWGGIGR